MLKLLLTLFLALVVTGCLSGVPQTSGAVITNHQKIGLAVNDHLLTVEAVTTPASITQGLSGRTEIGSDGMLFILPQPQSMGFWMKNMQFGLDIVWIQHDQIIGITADVPPPTPGTPDYQLRSHFPPDKVTAVLELSAGQAAKLGLSPGQTISLISLP